MNKRITVVLGIMVVLWAHACSAPEDVFDFVCDPDALLPSKRCLTQDAGVDADANDDPGFDPAHMAPPNSCKTGYCYPTPIGSAAGLWSEEPISLWVGPADQLPAKCPDDPMFGVPNEKFRLFDNLVAPPATCSPCTCAPSEGMCSGVPETLELRAGKCDQSGVATVPFDAPANWDGSCTNANTIAAGAKCPAGSQTLCTQSVHSSTLPLPADEACKPSVSAPSFEFKTSWQTAALACHGNTHAQSCGTDSLKMYCVNDPGPAWLQCTYREGVHEMCPDNYQHVRYVLFPKLPVDDRGCSACECGKPMGSACIGALSLSTDGGCSAELVKLQVGSMSDMCYDFLTPGVGLSSKAIVNRAYLPGMCAASGGEPVGNASADVDNAVTFCCLAPFPRFDPPR
jgi:hypothetical protein